jgi:methanethiol S-methyltransferase
VTRKILFFVYGVFCHALFLGVYACLAAFVGNFGFGVLPTIDGPAEGPLWSAVAIDLLLVAVFALQHSVMARPAFKAWWNRFVPRPIERSTYVLASSLATLLLLCQWRPIGGVVWEATTPWARSVLYGLFALGWLMVPAITFLINHFDLFGTRQVWLHLRGCEYTALSFRAPVAYRYVRHPLYVGWMIAFWAAPVMTVTHLVFALAMTAYILVAIPFEERDLIAHFGERYEAYRKSVGALVPWRRAATTARPAPVLPCVRALTR